MIRAAVIGLGWWGRQITKALRDSDVVRVTRGFDSLSEQATEFVLEQGFTLAPSFAAILDDPAVDAVVIAKPHSLHEAQALAALAAGKPVFCEKPLALSARGARGERTIKSFAAAPTVRANLEAWAAALGGTARYRIAPDEILDNARILEGVVLSARNGSAEIALEPL